MSVTLTMFIASNLEIMLILGDPCILERVRTDTDAEKRMVQGGLPGKLHQRRSPSGGALWVDLGHVP